MKRKVTDEKVQNQKRNPRRFPDRWLKYDAVGRHMPSTRFIAFKTPLHSDYFHSSGQNFKPEQIFETQSLVKYAADQGKELGLIIDLTATDKYYNPQEFEKFGIEYIKIRCMGHFVDTDRNTAERFVDAVSQFLHKNANSDKLIGVHCTHGLNRTGYLICKYLIEVDGLDAKEAIKKFEYYRGHKIERRRYINALLKNCVRGRLSHLAVPLTTEAIVEVPDLLNPKVSSSIDELSLDSNDLNLRI